MFFQQSPQRQLPFDRACADTFLTKSHSSLSLSTTSVGLDIPKVNRAPTPLNSETKKPYKIFMYDSNDIIAPAPKKPHQCNEVKVYKCGPRSLSPWGLSTLDEDSDEDTFEADLKSKLPDWNAESDAFAELLQIVHNKSPKTSQDPLPDLSEEDSVSLGTVQPMAIINKGIELEAILDDSTSGDLDLNQFLGRSPISRTQNPLPLDSMFSPQTASPCISSGNSRSGLTAISNTNNTELKTTGSSVHSYNLGRPLPLSFHRLHARPRSHSVGARSGKAGLTF
ncbi:hypothetical protein K7432_005923 [Basidiobolus ranarum]|uniref:Uncharacterized protein n=1 Tax=Basidiobolus ranarum TaxID=34480 RepID=A0ABR2WVX1_9FUNG